MRHEHVLAAQTQQVAACNALHELEERLSRWLLQSRDLLMSDTLPLTQEFLSQMLGVQRSSVTLVARKLQDAGLITVSARSHPGARCRGTAGHLLQCYTAINAHFHRLVGWSPDLDPQAPAHPAKLIRGPWLRPRATRSATSAGTDFSLFCSRCVGYRRTIGAALRWEFGSP